MKTYASFYDIVAGVKQETGISNLTNRYVEILGLIVRAERDINPWAGHFIRKKIKYTAGKGLFNGKSIKYPEDYIELIGVYDRIEYGRTELETVDFNTHIGLCNGLVNNEVILSYWATQMNAEGHPLVPYNHYEAVVAFIVWKLYSQRAFQDKGSLNMKMDYENIFERRCRAARGVDMFPSDESRARMRASMQLPAMFDVVCEDDCFCACTLEIDDTPTPAIDTKIWFWQEDSLVQILQLDDVTDDFLEDQSVISVNGFKAGTYFTSSYVGRYGIAIQDGPVTPAGIVDATGTSIESSVTYKYFSERKLLVLISQNYITPGTFFLKLN